MQGNIDNKGRSLWFFFLLPALVLMVLGGSRAWALELKVVAVPEAVKEALTEKAGAWSPFLALSLPPVEQRVEIDQRTEFHAFIIDEQDKLAGSRVIFTWYYRAKKTTFAKPVTRTLARRPGLPHAAATYYCWSAPSLRGKLLSLGGLSSVRSYQDWESSRCYGPRTVRVTDTSGAVLAEKSFEIHQPGVRVY